MYSVINIYTKEKHVFVNRFEVARVVKVTPEYINKLIREEKTSKAGWKIEKINKF